MKWLRIKWLIGWLKFLYFLWNGTGVEWFCPQCDCLNMSGRAYCGNCGRFYEG